MTYEEALKFLDEHNTSSVIPFEVKILCSQALVKRIPKKPNIREQGSTTVTRGFCTECLNTVYSYSVYCDRCGQAIDWSDSE